MHNSITDYIDFLLPKKCFSFHIYCTMVQVLSHSSDDVLILRIKIFKTYSMRMIYQSNKNELGIQCCPHSKIFVFDRWDLLHFSLNLHSQKLFEAVGSSMIDRLSFRDVWAFVGQQGILGHTTIEEVFSFIHFTIFHI